MPKKKLQTTTRRLQKEFSHHHKLREYLQRRLSLGKNMGSQYSSGRQKMNTEADSCHKQILVTGHFGHRK